MEESDLGPIERRAYLIKILAKILRVKKRYNIENQKEDIIKDLKV